VAVAQSKGGNQVLSRWVPGLILVILMIATGFAWAFGNAMTGRSAVPSSPLPQGAQLVHIKAEDGIDLVGNFWPGKTDHAPAILMLHGQGSSRNQFDYEGADFAEKGYAALAINFRGHGESGGDLRSVGYFESRDARAALGWLKEHQHGAKTAVIGNSLGGASALIGPGGPIPADAFVLTVVYPDIRHAIRNRLRTQIGWLLGSIGEPFLSYQSRFRFGVWPDAMSPVTSIHRLHVPVFIIGGGLDIYTPPDETQMLFNAANSPKQLWIVPGGSHDSTTEHPGYATKVTVFLDGVLIRD
jgi:pimeloyl-ACP methyl ester carboxylesterase